MRAGDNVTLSLPTPSKWDFGGHLYGLEPLTLPLTAVPPGDAGDELAGMPDDDLESSRNLLRTLGPDGSADPLEPPDPVERLFWFRWITGHQTTFVLWQMLARATAATLGDPGLAVASKASSRVFVRGYSAMLLYTGSCPRDIYHRVIRPSMSRQHPSFSGSWARDFWPVRHLLGARALSRPADSPLGRESALNGVIHQGIADKLVPDAPSLLQAASGQRLTGRRTTLAVLYDTYFLTLRSQISHRAVVLQLMRRLHAIARDLATNGLYPPYASSSGEKPPGLLRPDVVQCEQEFPETLFALATEAVASLGGRGSQ